MIVTHFFKSAVVWRMFFFDRVSIICTGAGEGQGAGCCQAGRTFCGRNNYLAWRARWQGCRPDAALVPGSLEDVPTLVRLSRE